MMNALVDYNLCCGFIVLSSESCLYTILRLHVSYDQICSLCVVMYALRSPFGSTFVVCVDLTVLFVIVLRLQPLVNSLDFVVLGFRLNGLII